MSNVNKLKDNEIYKGRVKSSLDETNDMLQEFDQDDVMEYIDWFKTKTDLRYFKGDEKPFVMNNGIYWAYLGSNIGSEQDLHRPVLIINTSKNSPVCTIVPLTLERLADDFWYHIDLEETNSTALVEHIRVISKRRIDKPMRLNGLIKSITENDWVKINEQLESLYRLKPLYKPKPKIRRR